MKITAGTGKVNKGYPSPVEIVRQLPRDLIRYMKNEEAHDSGFVDITVDVMHGDILVVGITCYGGKEPCESVIFTSLNLWEFDADDYVANMQDGKVSGFGLYKLPENKIATSMDFIDHLLRELFQCAPQPYDGGPVGELCAWCCSVVGDNPVKTKATGDAEFCTVSCLYEALTQMSDDEPRITGLDFATGLMPMECPRCGNVNSNWVSEGPFVFGGEDGAIFTIETCPACGAHIPLTHDEMPVTQPAPQERSVLKEIGQQIAAMVPKEDEAELLFGPGGVLQVYSKYGYEGDIEIFELLEFAFRLKISDETGFAITLPDGAGQTKQVGYADWWPNPPGCIDHDNSIPETLYIHLENDQMLSVDLKDVARAFSEVGAKHRQPEGRMVLKEVE